MNELRSAYLHIPFCHRRCFYCDFPVVPLGDKAHGEQGPGSSSIKSYLNLLHKEISLSPLAPPLSTVYIGGGTPSLLTPSQISSLLQHLRSDFGLQNGAEISLEIDPASFDKNSLKGFLDAGVNRVSLGGQSFDDHVLRELGRRHDRTQLLEACYLIDKSFRRGDLFSWSLDLIQNLPSQKLSCWIKQLETAISIYPPHISVYDLSIEKGTVFAWKQSKNQLSLPDEEVSSEISRMTSKTLREAGFSRYEISNYALPGHASRHNRVYWSGGGWLGFGQGATSCIAGKRFTRPRTREGYKKWLCSQENKTNQPFLSLKNSNLNLIPIDELIMVGLRRREGIDLQELFKRFNLPDNQFQIHLNSLKTRWEYSLEMGFIKQRGYRFYLTDPDGMEISNQILVEMLLWWEDIFNSYSFQSNL